MHISPSLLNAKLEEIPWKDIEKLCKQRACSSLHIDVMDTQFIGHTTHFTPTVTKNLPTNMTKDVHLMTARPWKQIAWYKNAGAKIINMHVEVGRVKETYALCKRYKLRLGLAINPETNVKEVMPYINFCDEFLVMSVHPGKGGQKFIPSTLRKVKTLRRFGKLIKVDGGIGIENIQDVAEAGADVAVVGSDIFKPHPVSRMKELLDLVSEQ